MRYCLTLEATIPDRFIARSIADDVKVILRYSLRAQRPSVENVAKEMRSSPRTLKSHLEELGNSYKRLLDDVRHDTALRLLNNANLGLGEVAPARRCRRVTNGTYCSN